MAQPATQNDARTEPVWDTSGDPVRPQNHWFGLHFKDVSFFTLDRLIARRNISPEKRQSIRRVFLLVLIKAALESPYPPNEPDGLTINESTNMLEDVSRDQEWIHALKYSELSAVDELAKTFSIGVGFDLSKALREIRLADARIKVDPRSYLRLAPDPAARGTVLDRSPQCFDEAIERATTWTYVSESFWPVNSGMKVHVYTESADDIKDALRRVWPVLESRGLAAKVGSAKYPYEYPANDYQRMQASKGITIYFPERGRAQDDADLIVAAMQGYRHADACVALDVPLGNGVCYRFDRTYDPGCDFYPGDKVPYRDAIDPWDEETEYPILLAPSPWRIARLLENNARVVERVPGTHSIHTIQ